MNNKTLISIIFLLVSTFSIACSCESTENFSKVALKADLVVLAKINKYLTFKENYSGKIPISMEIEIIEILKGKSSNKKIIIWGDNGILCRPYLDEFKEGESYFLALYSSEENYGHEDEKQNDYSISICGEYWMKADLNKKTAISNFNNKIQSISFKNIYSYFN